ncbi:MAG: hypothetical protein JO345_06765 [Streptosporangiaceae bacterium]|nr:hypothetical protein [Streptosporangiaceae bacterium]
MEWLGARRYLNEHRHELTLAAQALYPHDLRVAGTPLLARPEWLPDEPVPLDQVALTLREEADDGPPLPALPATHAMSAENVAPLLTMGPMQSDTELDAAEAEAEAVLRRYREWAAAGRPGAISHEEAMAELLGGR